jgi:heat shock protein HtpX
MFRRIIYFLGLNLILLLTFNLIISLLPVPPGYYGTLLIFYSIAGFGGAFISLLFSKRMAKWSMKVQIIDPKNAQGREQWLLNKVHEIARKANLPKMPEVGIYPGREVNAFATGPTKSNSLVAVSDGLLAAMDEDEVEGVLAHEVAHIKNGDMVTMVLLQGVINTLVMIVARVLADLVYSAMSRDNRGGGFFFRIVLYQVFAMVLGVLGMIVTGTFSRKREYRADHGGARLVGNNKMIKALEKLKAVYPPPHVMAQSEKQREAIASLQISGRIRQSKLAQLLSTHPPLDQRIATLKQRSL